MTVVNLYSYDSVNGTGAVTLFRDGNCSGDSAYFLAGEPGERKGYNKSDVEANDFSNDKLTGVMVPYGYTLTIFDDDGFTGSNATFQGMED